MRKIGYFITRNNGLFEFSVTKRGAMDKAKGFMKDPAISKVKIIRADDNLLLLTYLRTKDGFSLEKA
jgi:hypothetical protein